MSNDPLADLAAAAGSRSSGLRPTPRTAPRTIATQASTTAARSPLDLIKTGFWLGLGICVAQTVFMFTVWLVIFLILGSTLASCSMFATKPTAPQTPNWNTFPR